MLTGHPSPPDPPRPTPRAPVLTREDSREAHLNAHGSRTFNPSLGGHLSTSPPFVAANSSVPAPWRSALGDSLRTPGGLRGTPATAPRAPGRRPLPETERPPARWRPRLKRSRVPRPPHIC